MLKLARLATVPICLLISIWSSSAYCQSSGEQKLLVNPYAVADSPLLIAFQGLDSEQSIDWLIESNGQEQVFSQSGFEKLGTEGEVIFHPRVEAGEYVIRALIRNGEESLAVMRAHIKVLEANQLQGAPVNSNIAPARFVSDDQTSPFEDSSVAEESELPAESAPAAPMPMQPPTPTPTPVDPPAAAGGSPATLLTPGASSQPTEPLRLSIPASGVRKEEFLQQTRQRMIALRLTLEPRFLQHANALAKSFKSISQDNSLTDASQLLEKVTAASRNVVGPDKVPESVHRVWAQFLNNDSLAIAIANNINLQSKKLEDYQLFYTLLAEALADEAEEDTTTQIVAEYLVKKGFEPPGSLGGASGSSRIRKHCKWLRH